MKLRGVLFGIVLPLLIIIVLAAALYFSFMFTPKCQNLACWETKLKSWSRASFINEPIDVTWKYKINGKQDSTCKVEVTAVDIKRGLKKTEALEGKSMSCYLALGAVVVPEANPNLCNGRLKEEMQGLIIEKLHEYIISNIGTINKELTQIQGVTGSTTNLTQQGNNTGNNNAS